VPADAPAGFHLLAKPAGALCSLDCSYCFFLSKQLLYPGSNLRMSDEVLTAYVRQLIESHSRGPVVDLAWQGGEPTLMGIEFFQRAVELVEAHLRPGQRARYTLQTSGTKLDRAWATFLKGREFLIGISIDGPREIHDRFRVSRGGGGSFDQVMRGLAVLREAEVDYNVLTTVHAENERCGREVYRFLRDECDARFIQFIPVVERLADDAAEPWASWRDRPLYVQTGSAVTPRSVSPDGYGRFLVEIFEEWVRRDVGFVYVSMFDAALANWFGEPSGMCVHNETCGRALALEHNGDVYSCDHFVEPGHLLGNIRDVHLSELVSAERQREFGSQKRDLLPGDCIACDVRFACHGGCPKDRFATAPDSTPRLNYLCPSYKLFFHHIDPAMQHMAGRLAARGAPAEIMDEYARRDAARGRNELCPCGSGRKWKRCHGDPTERVRPARTLR
jgi:uncharacterized protein